MPSEMLSKFQIRNLRLSSQATEDQLVRVSAPGYDSMILENPAATLKYRDEDDDKIIVGSSTELIDKLEEPVNPSSPSSSRRGKDRMSIAMLLTEAQRTPNTLQYHSFDIEEREEIQKLWQEIQRRNRTPPPDSPILPLSEVQPVWTSEENELLYELEYKGLSYSEISEEMVGRSATACYQQYPVAYKDKMQKDDEKMDKLAVAYERLKHDIWNPIAASTGLPWEEVEALHWAMGRDEMMNRAEKLHTSRPVLSDETVLSKCIDGLGQPKCSLKTNNRRSSKQSPVQNFDDYREHYFNATKPPQMRNAAPASQVLPRFASGKAAHAGVAKSALSKGAASSSSNNPTVNLTSEGKRQAQAAGDILRSRTIPSRHRKATDTETEYTSYLNRWASYKTPNPGFSSQALQPQSQDFKALTLEGRRQAQAAGDKLRSRTNPIRHSRPSRSGSLENGVSKNRWASYVAPRAIRFAERYHAPSGESTERPQMDTIDFTMRDIPKSEPSAPAIQEKDQSNITVPLKDKQPSLLEVFEAELAKNISRMDDVTKESQAPEPEVVDIPIPENPSGPSMPNIPQRTRAHEHYSPGFHSVDMLGDYIRKLAMSKAELPQEICTIVDSGLRSASNALETLVRGTGLDHVERPRMVQRETDIRGIEDALGGLRSFVDNIATGFGRPHEVVASSSNARSEHQQPSVDSSTVNVDPVPKEQLSEAADRDPVVAASSPSPTLSTPKEGKSSSCADNPVKESPYSSVDSLPPNYGHVFDNLAALKLRIRDDHEASKLLRPHNYTNPLHSTAARSASKPAATRFPTLAQFEDDHLAGFPSFPALPSMKPLSPQRMSPQRAGNARDPQRYNDNDQEEQEISPSLPSPQRPACSDDGRAGLPSGAEHSNQGLAQTPYETPMIRDLRMQMRLREQRYNQRLITPNATVHGLAGPQHLAYGSYRPSDNEKQTEQELLQDAKTDYETTHPVTPKLQEQPKPSILHNHPPPSSIRDPSSAARLAGPFDPLDDELSAPPHVPQGIRRNATVGGSDSRYHPRRRRPYSEAFDGFGRVAWESFEDAAHDGIMAGKKKVGKQDDRSERGDRQQRRQRQSRTSSAFEIHDDEHLGDSNGEKINTCVKQLKDLGFGSDGPGSWDRLLVYAQAAEGDLVEAIDIIDEEQRAYRGL